MSLYYDNTYNGKNMGGIDSGDEAVFVGGAVSADEGEFLDEVEFLEEVGLSDAVAFPVVLPGGTGNAGGTEIGRAHV